MPESPRPPRPLPRGCLPRLRRAPGAASMAAALVTALAAALAGCVPAELPPDLAAGPPPGAALPVEPVVLPPPAPPPLLPIVDPPVQPGAAVAVSREGEPRPVVFYEQPARISPPGTPLVLPPPIPRGERQETLVEAAPARIVLGGGSGEHRRFVAFLNEVGRGRFDALHLEIRGRNRRAVSAAIGAARRAGVDSLKISAVDVPAAGGAVEVIATRFVATAPVCPSLAVVGPSANDNDFEPTLGCSNRRNLAAMVNDPADLLANDAVVPADGARAAIGIERYRAPLGALQGAARQDGYGQAPFDYGNGFGYGPPGGTVLGPGGPVSR